MNFFLFHYLREHSRYISVGVDKVYPMYCVESIEIVSDLK